MEEDSVITGYIKTSADRTGYLIKSPATSGIATLVTPASDQSYTLPGSSGTILLTAMLSGDATATTSGVVTVANSAVIGKVLTGFTSGAGIVAATDTILQAVQKLNGNISAVVSDMTSADALAVHLAGTETITGAKTFSLSPIFSSGTASTVPYLDSSKNLVSSAVTPTELGYVSGVTSAIQTQIDGKLATSSFTDTAVTGKVLTGFTSGAGTVSATDTILQAIQKLNGNIAGAVTGVSGTANRITSSGGTTPVIDISSSYAGQSSITILGTIATGTWQGTIIDPAYGGTGVNNGTKRLP